MLNLLRPLSLQHLPQVSRMPPLLRRGFLARFYSWLTPVFRVTDEALVQSAGLDALIAVGAGEEVECSLVVDARTSLHSCPITRIKVRILGFGIMLLVPLTAGGMIILAVNYTGVGTREQHVDGNSVLFLALCGSKLAQSGIARQRGMGTSCNFLSLMCKRPVTSSADNYYLSSAQGLSQSDVSSIFMRWV